VNYIKGSYNTMYLFRILNERFKYILIRICLQVAAHEFIHRFFSAARGKGVIFTLHHVQPKSLRFFSPNEKLSVKPEFLESAIIACLESGLTPVHLHDLPSLLSNPTERRRFVVFTLDDGYRDNAKFAAPIFKKFSVPYTIFITQGFVERSRTMWWETAAALIEKVLEFEFDFGNGIETIVCDTPSKKFYAFNKLARFVHSSDEDTAVRMIDQVAIDHCLDPVAIVDKLVMNNDEVLVLSQDNLVHFGAHTVNHVNLSRVNKIRLRSEIVESISAIEKLVGERPCSFSYPYGWSSACDEREAMAVAKAGMHIAVTTRPGMLKRSSLCSLRLLSRVSLNGAYQEKRFVKAILSGIPFIFTK